MVLHVGRLAVEKDIDSLVAAFQQARSILKDEALFCVAGDGPRAAFVRSELPFAHHLGFLDRANLADLYADADLFVFPSATETCGLVALEAMASGIPVIGSDAGGIRENLRDGINGIMAPTGDADAFSSAIVDLVRDPIQRDAMAQAARGFAVACDWDAALNALEPMYLEAIRAAGGVSSNGH